jgi:hypothetical protein
MGSNPGQGCQRPFVWRSGALAGGRLALEGGPGWRLALWQPLALLLRLGQTQQIPVNLLMTHVRNRGVAAQAKTLLEDVSPTTILGGPFLVVLDALDKCYFENGRQGGDAVPMLLDKFKLLGCIKFLITSRDEGPIWRMFKTFQSQVALHDIEQTIIQRDIYHYLQHLFAELACSQNLDLPFPSAQDLDELVRRAGPLFIYAVTVTKWISDPGARPLLRLQQVLEKDEDEVLYQHKFLDDMYFEILLQAAETSGNPRKHVCALKNIISVVILLQEPVLASTLAILAGCHSFPEPLAPVSCFRPSPVFLSVSTKVQKVRDISHDCDATHLACDPCYNHPSSYGTCFLPAVHPAVPLSQFSEPLAPVSCFGHLWCSFLFPPSPEARDVSHDRDATRLACDPCYYHPSSYRTCFFPAVHSAVPSYQLLSTRLSGRLG